MRSPLLETVSVAVPVLGWTTTWGQAMRMFGSQAALRSLLLSDDSRIAVVHRPDRGAAPVRPEHPALGVACRNPLRLPYDLGLGAAGPHVLDRPDSDHLDVVIEGPGRLKRVAPLTRLLEELARLYRHRAGHDVLTGLPNRGGVMEQLTVMRSWTDRHGGHVAALFIDLDDFKHVNDRHGHHTGDRMLMEVASRLRAAVRRHDLVGRIGGDEFLVAAVVPTLNDLPGLRSRVATATHVTVPIAGGQTARLGATIGCACMNQGDSAADVLASADADMYLGKRGALGTAPYQNADMPPGP